MPIPPRILLHARTLARFPNIARCQSTKGTANADSAKKSFRGQLYESTAQRVQNERAALRNAKLRGDAIGGAGGAGGGAGRPERASVNTLGGIFGEFAFESVRASVSNLIT